MRSWTLIQTVNGIQVLKADEELMAGDIVEVVDSKQAFKTIGDLTLKICDLNRTIADLTHEKNQITRERDQG